MDATCWYGKDIQQRRTWRRRSKNDLASKDDPHFFAKANGYRVYISLYGALGHIPQKEVQANKEVIHEYLQEMAQFYAENMTDGMRRHFAD